MNKMIPWRLRFFLSTFSHIHKYVCVCAWVYIYECVCVCVCARVCVCVCSCVYVHASIHKYVCACIYVCAHGCVHSYLCVCVFFLICIVDSYRHLLLNRGTLIKKIMLKINIFCVQTNGSTSHIYFSHTYL